MTIEELTDGNTSHGSDIYEQTIIPIPPLVENGQDLIEQNEKSSTIESDKKITAIELLELAKSKADSLEERIKNLLSSTVSWNTETSEKQSETLSADEGPTRNEMYEALTSDASDVLVRPSEILSHEPVEETVTEPCNEIDYITNAATFNGTLLSPLLPRERKAKRMWT